RRGARARRGGAPRFPGARHRRGKNAPRRRCSTESARRRAARSARGPSATGAWPWTAPAAGAAPAEREWQPRLRRVRSEEQFAAYHLLFRYLLQEHYSAMTVRAAMLRIFQQEDINFLLTNRIPRQLLTRFMGWFSKIEQPMVRELSIAAWR